MIIYLFYLSKVVPKAKLLILYFASSIFIFSRNFNQSDFSYLYSMISSNDFLGLLAGASSAKPTATIPVNWLSVPI